MKVIEINNLTKNYGKNRGIDNLSLHVEEGEFFGFIGPNGAGKSTTIRTLLGLISPTSGNAKILDRDIVTQKKEILADIGYMPSEAIFYQGMKVKDVILFSQKSRKIDCSEEAKVLCSRLSLDTEKRVEELSLGNRKKVAIVCALQHKPKLYILDEPTSGLDPLIQKEFFKILKERNKEGATIFLSSHVLSEVQKNCSAAAIIKEGKIIVEGKIENFLKTKAKKVLLHGINNLPKNLKVKSIESSSDSISFLYDGDIKELLKTIATLPITDVSITEPDLEEIFMHYYESEENK